MRVGLSQLQRDGVLPGWIEGIDRYHLLERLAAALEVAESDAAERKRLLEVWQAQFDMPDSTIDAIDRYLTARYRELPVDRQRLLWEHMVYIANNKDRMRYVSLAIAGLPCGSGVTESAAKTVVNRHANNSVGASTVFAMSSCCEPRFKAIGCPAFGPTSHVATRQPSKRPERDPCVVHTRFDSAQSLVSFSRSKTLPDASRLTCSNVSPSWQYS